MLSQIKFLAAAVKPERSFNLEQGDYGPESEKLRRNKPVVPNVKYTDLHHCLVSNLEGTWVRLDRRARAFCMLVGYFSRGFQLIACEICC